MRENHRSKHANTEEDIRCRNTPRIGTAGRGTTAARCQSSASVHAHQSDLGIFVMAGKKCTAPYNRELANSCGWLCDVTPTAIQDPTSAAVTVPKTTQTLADASYC